MKVLDFARTFLVKHQQILGQQYLSIIECDEKMDDSLVLNSYKIKFILLKNFTKKLEYFSTYKNLM